VEGKDLSGFAPTRSAARARPAGTPNWPEPGRRLVVFPGPKRSGLTASVLAPAGRQRSLQGFSAAVKIHPGRKGGNR
jgi:hypothetical protein